MKALAIPLGVVVAVATVLVAGCTQAPPPAAPTAAPAVPTSAPAAPKAAPAVPTTAPVAPTTAPAASKVQFPEKGKSITLIVPWAAGGGADATARLLAMSLEKELGVSVPVINKPGGSSQVGMVDVARAKPDGYTLGYPSIPTTLNTYLDASREAAYGRKDFVPVANQVYDVNGIAVKKDSPYKTLKEVIDDAKARPGQIRLGTAGILSVQDLTALQFEKITGTKFAYVHFDAGSAPMTTALLGGHIDLVPDLLGQYKSYESNARLLAVADTQRSDLYPDVPTMQELGFPLVFSVTRGVWAPAGTPKEVISILSSAIGRAVQTPEYKQKLAGLGAVSRFMDADAYGAFWDAEEAKIRPILEMADLRSKGK